MKPRLKVEALSEEDEWIWFGVVAKFEPYHIDLAEVIMRAVDQDRRDAELMYFLEANREHCFEQRFYEDGRPVVLVPLVHVLVYIDPDWPQGHYILNFA